MPLIKSWVESANDPSCPFPLNNLPCGVFSEGDGFMRCGVAIGDQILDCKAAEDAGLLTLEEGHQFFFYPGWNEVMEEGPELWVKLRKHLTELLEEGSSHQAKISKCLVAQSEAAMHMPFFISEFTDFYSGRRHATNVGTMFRGEENALPPNWLHIPIAYNGRASSVVVSGTGVRRPWGQLKSPKHDLPAFLPSRRFDFELEMGAVIGQSSDGPVTVEEADKMIFGYVLLNDWSARDIQAWEYQPLGPFQAKATATTISPWIVMADALEPFRASAPERDFEFLPYLQEPGPMLYDIELEVGLAADGKPEAIISQTNYAELYYSAAQQLAHHTTSGCPMQVGDLLGSGTISGPQKDSRGSMLELSWGGKEPLELDNEQRTFLEDGDTVVFRGTAKGDGYNIGFGDCSGKVLPALEDPYKR
ncbi:MAG: fumarylacetoacetase [Pseudomonadota bacterium]